MSRPCLSPDPVVRRLGVSMLLLLGTSAWGGCAGGLRSAAPDEPLEADEVLLLGEAVFEPADWQSSSDFAEMWLGFTREADTPVAPDRANDEDLVVPVQPGRPFAVVAPRRDLYLRSVTVAWRKQDTRTGYNQVRKRYAKCVDDRPVEIRPDDEAVYLGRIVCRYVRPDELTMENAWEATAPALEEVVGGRPVRCLPCELRAGRE